MLQLDSMHTVYKLHTSLERQLRETMPEWTVWQRFWTNRHDLQAMFDRRLHQLQRCKHMFAVFKVRLSPRRQMLKNMSTWISKCQTRLRAMPNELRQMLREGHMHSVQQHPIPHQRKLFTSVPGRILQEGKEEHRLGV